MLLFGVCAILVLTTMVILCDNANGIRIICEENGAQRDCSCSEQQNEAIECVVSACLSKNLGSTFLKYKQTIYSDLYIAHDFLNKDCCLVTCASTPRCHGVSHFTWANTPNIWSCYQLGQPNKQIPACFTSYGYGSYYERNYS